MHVCVVSVVPTFFCTFRIHFSMKVIAESLFVKIVAHRFHAQICAYIHTQEITPKDFSLLLLFLYYIYDSLYKLW